MAAEFKDYEIFRYITKPFRRQKIIDTVEKALEKHDLKKDSRNFRHEFDTEKLPFTVRKAVEFILENFHRDIGVNEIAAAVGCDRRHLPKIFRRHLGQTPRDLLREVRMNEPKRLIETTPYSVKIVGQKCGYRTDWHFIQTFKNTFGRTPGGHRRDFSQF